MTMTDYYYCTTSNLRSYTNPLYLSNHLLLVLDLQSLYNLLLYR